MKQGKASIDVRADTKQEPVSRAINPNAVGQIGIAQAVRPDPMHQGRGYAAPSIGTSIHPRGSQGKR